MMEVSKWALSNLSMKAEILRHTYHVENVVHVNQLRKKEILVIYFSCDHLPSFRSRWQNLCWVKISSNTNCLLFCRSKKICITCFPIEILCCVWWILFVNFVAPERSNKQRPLHLSWFAFLQPLPWPVKYKDLLTNTSSKDPTCLHLPYPSFFQANLMAAYTGVAYSIQQNAKTYPLSIGSVATAAMMTPRLGEIP